MVAAKGAAVMAAVVRAAARVVTRDAFLRGVDYPTATIGGRVWMTRNLRYLPDGAQIGTGIWYPCRGTAGSNDAEYVAERGLLYSFTTALGGATAASGTPVQGICPPGWHVPTGAEIEQMLASPEYDASLLRSAGMWNSETGRYLTETKGYLMSCTRKTAVRAIRH